MAAGQESDPDILQLLTSMDPTSSLHIKCMPLQSSTATILCDVSTGVPCPLVPITLRRQVFQALHTLAHPVIRATQHVVTARFVWPRINHDVRSWTQASNAKKSKV